MDLIYRAPRLACMDIQGVAASVTRGLIVAYQNMPGGRVGFVVLAVALVAVVYVLAWALLDPTVPARNRLHGYTAADLIRASRKESGGEN